MGVSTISAITYFNHQRTYLYPAVINVWQSFQQRYLSRMIAYNQALCLGGDGQADTPGHSAKFGSYALLDLNHMVVAHIQLVQVFWTEFYTNIDNGNIFPSLNPAKIFSSFPDEQSQQKVRQLDRITCAVINTSNEVKSPLLWEFRIYNFSLRILERVLGWKHCKYKKWVSFCLCSWEMNRSAEQTNQPRTASRFTRFVCPALRFIPHEHRKKDTHSLIRKRIQLRCVCETQMSHHKFS